MSTTIIADLEAGESPILLTRLNREPFVPRSREGKSLHASAAFRWASSGSHGHKLEVIKTPTGIATTRSAVLRFFSALSGGGNPNSPQRTNRERNAARSRAENELAAAGI